MKRVVFFDGDGTLWHPKSTLRTKPPDWIYSAGFKSPERELELTPGAESTLRELGLLGVMRILLSTTPFENNRGIVDRTRIARHMGICSLLDDIRVAPDKPSGKSERLEEILEEYQIQPDDALMVGDNLLWDCRAATNVGVTAILLSSSYESVSQQKRDSPVAIHTLDEVIDHTGVFA